MSTNQPVKQKKLELSNEEAGVSHPWKAFMHPEKNRVFYVNTITQKSYWDHPNTLKDKKKVEKVERKMAIAQRKVPLRQAVEQMDCEPMDIDFFHKTQKTKVVKADVGGTGAKGNKEDLQLAPRHNEVPTSSIDPRMALPKVPWVARPYTKMPYRCFAIFDTCALLNKNTKLLEIVEKKVFSVIPYAAFTEFEGLKKNDRLRIKVNEAGRKATALAKKHPYLRAETSVEETIEIPNFVPKKNLMDDLIMKCAMRIELEVNSIRDQLKLDSQKIMLVTDDVVLTARATANQLQAVTVDEFLKIMDGCSPSELPKVENVPKEQLQEETEFAALARELNSIGRQQERSKAENSATEAVAKKKKKKKSKTEKAIAREERDNTHVWLLESKKKEEEREAAKRPLNYSGVDQIVKRPRPSIPLADEVLPDYEDLELNQPTGPVVPPPKKLPNPAAGRPQMPINLSDDEGNEDDSMDCS